MIVSDPPSLFLDTEPFIYYLEAHPDFLTPVEALLTRVLNQNWPVATSVVSLCEFSVLPHRQHNGQVIQAFHELCETLSAPIL